MHPHIDQHLLRKGAGVRTILGVKIVGNIALCIVAVSTEKCPDALLEFLIVYGDPTGFIKKRLFALRLHPEVLGK
jgi:hypothetical protein